MQMTVTQIIKAAAAIITMTTNTAKKYNKKVYIKVVYVFIQCYYRL